MTWSPSSTPRWCGAASSPTLRRGRTLGVVGLGSIGCAVARRALGLEMNVVGWSRSLTPARAKALGMKTVLLVPQDDNHEFVDAWEKRSEDDRHIDYATSNLTAFLNALL